MGIAQSRVTSQGQISVPAEIRRRLAIGPGAVIEWDEENDQIVVRRIGKYNSTDIHDAIFPSPPEPKTTSELKAGLRQHIKARHARG